MQLGKQLVVAMVTGRRLFVGGGGGGGGRVMATGLLSFSCLL